MERARPELSALPFMADALGIVTEFFEAFDIPPFGLTLQDIVAYAMSRFERRAARIERARQGGLAMVEAAGDPAAELLEWVAERVGPLAVTRREGDLGALTLEVGHEQRPAAIMIAPEVLDQLLSMPVYQPSINGRQEVMVGYSDSAPFTDAQTATVLVRVPAKPTWTPAS